MSDYDIAQEAKRLLLDEDKEMSVYLNSIYYDSSFYGNDKFRFTFKCNHQEVTREDLLELKARNTEKVKLSIYEKNRAMVSVVKPIEVDVSLRLATQNIYNVHYNSSNVQVPSMPEVVDAEITLTSDQSYEFQHMRCLLDLESMSQNSVEFTITY